MKCRACSEEKLREEFPSKPYTARCHHFGTQCLSCIKSAVDSAGDFFLAACPECGASATNDDVRHVVMALEQLECPVFRDLDAIRKSKQDAPATIPATGSVEVVLLDGQRCSLELTRETTIGEMKQRIFQLLHVPAGQQRIMHGGQELKGSNTRWMDTKIKYGSVLQLVVIMYETGVGPSMPGSSSSGVRALVFDLSWTSRSHAAPVGRHMNGSCIVLDQRMHFVVSVDFQHLSWLSIQHQGKSRQHCPRQRMTVSMSGLGSSATYLFFVLSVNGYAGVSLSEFSNPRVELLDANTHTSLASYTAAQATAGEAVVLCCAKRHEHNGTWSVQRIGSTARGSVRYPDGLITGVRRIACSGAIM